jgi:hypothetical protein
MSSASPPAPPGYTAKQGQYLAFIHAYRRLHDQAPAEADIQRFFRVSPPSVHQMILKLSRRPKVLQQALQPKSLRGHPSLSACLLWRQRQEPFSCIVGQGVD